MKLDDLTGKRFGKLTVITRHIDKSKQYTLWECKCDCGNTVLVRANMLKHGRTKSCGCLRAESNILKKTTHGKSGTRLYAVWSGMKGRCYNPNNHNYKRYGMRGIVVCDSWRDSFENFSDWAISHGYQPGLSIERIDNDGNYCPENCTWSNTKGQNNNRSVSRNFSYNGKTQNLSQWCAELGIPYFRTWQRIVKYGYSFEEALFIPKNKHNQKRNE